MFPSKHLSWQSQNFAQAQITSEFCFHFAWFLFRPWMKKMRWKVVELLLPLTFFFLFLHFIWFHVLCLIACLSISFLFSSFSRVFLFTKLIDEELLMVMVELESSRIVGNVVTVWINVEIWERITYFIIKCSFCCRQEQLYYKMTCSWIKFHYVEPFFL